MFGAAGNQAFDLSVEEADPAREVSDIIERRRRASGQELLYQFLGKKENVAVAPGRKRRDLIIPGIKQGGRTKQLSLFQDTDNQLSFTDHYLA